MNIKEEPAEQMLDGQENHTPSNNHLGDSEPTFSDDEEEATAPTLTPIPRTPRSTEEDEDDDDIPLGDARSQSLPVMTLWLI
jgi:hypothetical protein